MNDDVLPALLEEVQDNFGQEFGKSEVIVKALKTLEAKKATYANTNDFAIEVGEILSKALTTSVTADKLPDGKMYYNIAKRLLEPVLQQNHELVADYSSKVQTVLNESAKISLAAQPVELNQDRINGFIERFSKEDKFDDVKWLLGDPIVNFTQSIVDDSIKKNADFHAKAGLQPKIVRKTAGRGCKWCQSLAGSYNYPDVPKDVYRRHQNCRCTVDYKPGDGKKKNIWSKKVTADSKNEREQRRQMNIDIRDNNRKTDIREYKKVIDVLGYRNAPISFAKFQEMKYNDTEKYEQLVDKTFIQNKFDIGEWLDKINPEKEARHFQSSVAEGKSYFYDDVDVEELYNKYKQTSKFRRTRKGRNEENYEMINLPDNLKLGKDVYTGEYINGFTIHYSKTGSHIIPTYHRKEGKNET